jgi:hypothetical protein
VTKPDMKGDDLALSAEHWHVPLARVDCAIDRSRDAPNCPHMLKA